jgi:hypothetical protein
LRRYAAPIALLPVAWAAPVDAAREPVLKQVDVPHSYYWRELYLPQLTTGPSSASFLPGGRELVYSMAGSLWRQTIGADEAVELTHATGAYDYQPDVSADGRSVVFSRYDGAGLELWRLDLASGREQRLTSDGAVNVEPRLSPDGRRLAWVSTRRNGRFDLHVADIGPDGLQNARRFPRSTAIDRYYSATTMRSTRHGLRTASGSTSWGTRMSRGVAAISGRSRPTTRRIGAACCVRRRAGAQGPSLRPTDAGCSIRAITGGRHISSGSRPPRVHRHCL